MLPEVLFRRICQRLPIACVDLLIQNDDGKLFFVKRRDEPAGGCWWFPGGRIWHDETRMEAVNRKLQEETGLKANKTIEISTYDLIFPKMPAGIPDHGITTLYFIEVFGSRFQLDYSSELGEWKSPEEWMLEDLHPFMKTMLLEGISFLKKL
jgi:colanic acid biosynthesis protein WcaH